MLAVVGDGVENDTRFESVLRHVCNRYQVVTAVVWEVGTERTR